MSLENVAGIDVF